MTTNPLPTETTLVDMAEQARLALDPMRANELLRTVAPDFTIQQVLELDNLRFNNFFRGLRIRLSVLSQEFSRRPLAVYALPYLKHMLALLNYYHSSPELQAKAAAIETDPHGSEYMMLAEMWRDIAGYCLKVAALTGDDQFLADAQAAYRNAVEASKPESNVQPLAKFEALVATFNANVPIPLRTLEEYWHEIITRTNDHDRIAKASWEMMQVARRIKNQDLERRARTICQQHADYLPGGYVKYAMKRLVRSVIQPVQHLTYRGESAQLRVSSITDSVRS